MEQIPEFKILAKVVEKKTTEYLMEDEKSSLWLKEKDTVLAAVKNQKVLLSNAKPMGQGIQILGGEKIPTLSKEDYLACEGVEEKIRELLPEHKEKLSQVTEDRSVATEYCHLTRTVVAVVVEQNSHISGYKLDNGEYIDIYAKDEEHFTRLTYRRYTNAYIRDDKTFQVANELELDYEEGVSPTLVNTRPNNLIYNLHKVMGEDFIPYPEIFYIYEPYEYSRPSNEVASWIGRLTTEAKEWVAVTGKSCPFPKPLSYVQGKPVASFEYLLHEVTFDCCADLSLFDGSTLSLDNMFYQCYGLRSVTLPFSLSHIGESAFAQTKLTKVSIPNPVRSIGESAFKGCKSLQELTLSHALDSIGDAAFQRCTSLTEVKCPTYLTSIQEYAFADCTSLSTLKLSPQLTFLGDGAFSNCGIHGTVTLPVGMKYIGEDACDEGVALVFGRC